MMILGGSSQNTADPEALGGGLAEMEASGAVARDGDGHRFVIFTFEDANARGGAEVALLEEFKERGVLFIDPQDFVGVPGLGVGESYSAMPAAEAGHPTEEGHAVRTAAVAPETLQ